MSSMSRFLRDFWLEGSTHRVPGFPLGLLRILMGAFWLAQVPGATACGPIVALVIALSGISLFFGVATRVGASLGAIVTALYVLTFPLPPGESLWPYVLLAIVHLVLAWTHCGQNLGVDQILAEKLANWPGDRTGWMRLLQELL